MPSSVEYINVGNEEIGNGQTVQFDHSVQTFTVSVRSMGGVGIDTIKNLIEKRHEVVAIEEVANKIGVYKL